MYKQTTTLEQAFSMVYRVIVMDWFHFNTFLSDCTIIRWLKDNFITDMVVAMEAHKHYTYRINCNVLATSLLK